MSEDVLKVALRWVIEHKHCSGFPLCWAAASPMVRDAIVSAWGNDPWPRDEEGASDE